jgi:hypothetical protein
MKKIKTLTKYFDQTRAPKKTKSSRTFQKSGSYIKKTHSEVPPKRRRDDSCTRLDLDGSPASAAHTRASIDDIKWNCGQVNVVTLKNVWIVPQALSAVTDHVLLFDDWIVMKGMRRLLLDNDKMQIYAFVLIIDQELMDSGDLDLPLDWSRIHATHIVMPGYHAGENAAQYTERYRHFSQAATNVYFALEHGLQFEWLADQGMNKCMIMKEKMHWRKAMGSVPSGLVAFNLQTLNDDWEEWVADTLNKLEHGAAKHRRLDVMQDDPEQRAMSKFRQNLKDVLKGAIQSPGARQPYHRFIGNNAFRELWLSYLQKDYPHFCSLKGNMFLYNAVPIKPEALLEENGFHQARATGRRPQGARTACQRRLVGRREEVSPE